MIHRKEKINMRRQENTEEPVFPEYGKTQQDLMQAKEILLCKI